VDTCVFRLADQSKWKAMSADAIASVNTPGLILTAPMMPHLVSNTLDPVALSNDIEKQIRALIIQHRKVFKIIKIFFFYHFISKISLGSWLYYTI
jgi:centrosomal protein CEP76